MTALQKGKKVLMPSVPGEHIPYPLIIVFILIAAIIIGISYFYLKYFDTTYRSEIENELTTIADLKTSQLVYWREERIADALILQKNPHFVELVKSYFDNPLAKTEDKKQLDLWLSQYMTHHEYSQISLFDPEVNLHTSFPSNAPEISASVSEAIGETLQSGKIKIVDLYRNEYDQKIYLSLLIPIANLTADKQIIGVVSIKIDPSIFLYPYLLRWPTPSETAETLIVRREGENVLFLNNLKFNKYAVLNLRIPLIKTEVAAVKAVLGQTGIIYGIDYKNSPVVADVRAITGSPWFLITRIDKAEILSHLRSQFWIVFGLVTTLLFSAGLSIIFIWKQQTLGFYHKQHEISKSLQIVAARLQKSNEELQQFAYIASHDLQEPLRMIASYLQLIERRYKGKLDKDADEFIGFAVDGAVRLQGMITGLLNYSRVQTKGFPFQEVNTSDLVGKAIINLKVLIDENRAIITTDELPMITADSSQIIQVFQNLLYNAIKFKSKKPPYIHISAKKVIDEGGRIVDLTKEIRSPNAWLFSVKDNGIGIANKYNDRIFNIFQRLHGQQYPGVGIGLSLCKKVLERHGGRIWFESIIGEGTVFYFTIPIQEKTVTTV